MQKRQRHPHPALVFLGGFALLGLAGVLFYAVGLLPASLRAAASGEPPDASVGSALVLGAAVFALVGLGLIVSAVADVRRRQRAQKAHDLELRRAARARLAENRQSVVGTLQAPVFGDEE